MKNIISAPRLFGVRLAGCTGWLLASAVILLWAGPAAADHPDKSGPFPHITHLEVKGIVKKTEPSMMFVQTLYGLRPRTISNAKVERMGLYDAKVGDELILVMDEGNLLIDAHEASTPGRGHRIIAGDLKYVDHYWEEIQLSSPEGSYQFEVDPLAGNRLSILQEGMPVELELDEDNVVIDIHRSR